MAKGKSGKSGSVGTIWVGLRVANNALEKGLRAAAKSLKRFYAQVAPLGDAVGLVGTGVAKIGRKTIEALGGMHTAAAALISALAVNRLREWHASLSQSIDATAKMADTLGTSSAALAGLHHAAGLAGVDVGTLNSALGKLGIELAKAQIAGDGAEGVFARLGLNAAQLASTDRVVALAMVADRLAQISNQAEKAAIATELFGRSGAELGPLIASGSQAILDAMGDAAALGITYTREQAAAVEAANDAWTRMGAAIQGVGTSATIAIAPLSATVGNAVTDALGHLSRWVSETIKGADVSAIAFDFVGQAIRGVQDAIEALRLRFIALQSRVTRALARIVDAFAHVWGAVERVADALPGVSVETSYAEYARAIATNLDQLASEQWRTFEAELAKPPRNDAPLMQWLDNLKQKAKEVQEEASKAATVNRDWSAQAEIAEWKKDQDIAKREAMRQPTRLFAKAMEAGSQEARSTVLNWQRGQSNAQERVARATQQIETNTLASAATLERIYALLSSSLNSRPAQPVL